MLENIFAMIHLSAKRNLIIGFFTIALSVSAFGTSAYAAIPAPDWIMQFNGDYTNAEGNTAYDAVKTGGESIATDGTRGQVFLANGQNKSTGGNFMTITQPYTQGTSFTKAAWVYMDADAGSGGRNIISHLGQFGTGANAATFYYSTYFWIFGGKLGAGHFLNGNGGLAQVVVDPTTLTANTWVHAAVTYDAATKRFTLYRNGVAVQTNTTTVHPVDSPIVQVGSFGDNFTWKGKIDDAEMWTGVAFTAEQILEVYNGDTGLIPSEPRAATGMAATSAGATSVDLSWVAAPANGSAITDYIVEYRPSTGGVWSTFDDGTATTTTATVTGLTNGTSYQFRVKAVNAVGTGSASDYTVATPGETEKVYYILSTGQSLAMGYNSTIALTTAQPYTNLMFDPGVEATATPLIPLVESGQGERGNVETPSSGMVNSLSAYRYNEFPFALGLHGKSGTAYSGLQKDSTPYNTGITQVTNAKSYLDGVSKTIIPIAITNVHGESDYYAGLASTYAANLLQWQTDYKNDVNAITGRNDALPMFINQMNTAAYGDIAQAQLDAHQDNPGKIILVGPKYQYTYASDHLHLTNTQSKHSGEMFAKVINKVVFEGETWNPLMPTSVSRSENIVTIDYAIPTGTLAIDTTNVTARTNYGFEFSETGGSGTTISSVELIEGDTKVKITLSGTPTGTDQRIKYAWTCPLGTGVDCGNSASASYVGGNIRDTDTSVSGSPTGTGLPLYDWGVAFNEAISYDETAPVRSSGSPSSTIDTVSSTTVSLTTNESATCRYSNTAGTAYGSMSAFSSTGSTTHTLSVSDLALATTYTYYVRCQDSLGNTNTDDYTIAFTIGSRRSNSSAILALLSAAKKPPAANGATVTRHADGTATVTFIVSAGTAYMMVSPDISFTHAKKLPPVASIDVILKEDPALYVRYCNGSEVCSEPTYVDIAGSSQSAIAAIGFTGNIGKGAKGDSVRVLQQMLARDSRVYPSGKVTGTFGPLTKAAVQRFQLTYGVVANTKTKGYGFVGPKTTAKLIEIFGQ